MTVPWLLDNERHHFRLFPMTPAAIRWCGAGDYLNLQAIGAVFIGLIQALQAFCAINYRGICPLRQCTQNLYGLKDAGLQRLIPASMAIEKILLE